MEEVRGDDTLEEVFLELEDTGASAMIRALLKNSYWNWVRPLCAAAKLVSNAPGWGRLATRCCLRH